MRISDWSSDVCSSDLVDALQAAIDTIDAEAGMHLAPFRAAAQQLTAIPGVKELAARSILAEIGVDMSLFPSAGHLLSWARMCPRNDESAGKRRSSRLGKGGNRPKTTLVQ